MRKLWNNSKFNLAIFIISIFVLIISIFFISKYYSYKKDIEDSTESSYKSFVVQVVEFQKDFKEYINSNKDTEKERSLVISLIEAQKSFETYGVLANLGDNFNSPLYQQRHQFFLEFWGKAYKDYRALSIAELKKVETDSSYVIQELQESGD